MKARWPSLVRIKDILLAAVATTALIAVGYTYVGGRFMESSKIIEMVAHAGDRDIHLNSLKNEQLQKTVTKEVMDLRFEAVFAKLDVMKATIDKIEEQQKEIRHMFNRLINRDKGGR